ncbi:MAG TPA: Sua5/YciO/YrdC/YwlC family protein [Candidatus Nanopelagicus sp.]|nr:Sua5/YciO/YrdC/YwlC family protein [Candidatus Nanopelagicus sp.]
MAERIRDFIDSESRFIEAVDSAVRYINAGTVIIVATESGYAYVANAFDTKAVKSIHVMRGDSEGIAAQVFIKGIEVLAGIAHPINFQQRQVLEKFWPGQLSVTIKSQPGLNWDLGDERRLGKINVRVPNKKFISKVLEKTGPLATASIAFTGRTAIVDLSQIIIREAEVGAVFDEGILENAGHTTIVEFSENEITLQREGAVSILKLKPLIPSILPTNL